MNKQFVSEKVQERLFNAILKRPDNQECADCSAKGPRWVSLDFGVFICMNCAGAHRTLGPSVTRVRSTKLDGWYQENIDIMENIGNGPANSFWENQIPKGSGKPPINASLDQLIRFVQEKYVKKLYIPIQVQDPKSFYLTNNKQLKPYYFEEHSTSDTQQSQEQQKPQLGDLIEMDEDEFQEFKQSPFKQFNPIAQIEIKSNLAEVGPQSMNSLSPDIIEKKSRIAQNQQSQTSSFPSLDILNLYNQNQQNLSNTGTQQSVPAQTKSNYAYLQQMGHHSANQNSQNQTYQYYQQPLVQPQIQMNYLQPQTGPVDIMQLYGQQKVHQHPHSFHK